MAYNQYDLNTTSLVKTGILTEMYIPLWWYSSGNVNEGVQTTAGSAFIQKGAVGISTSNTATQIKLHTLNSNWSTNQKFSLECSIQSYNSSFTAYAELWDITTNSGVVSSQISTTSASFTLLRSGQFTLIPGHTYGVVIWCTSGGGCYLTKASLIAFLS